MKTALPLRERRRAGDLESGRRGDEETRRQEAGGRRQEAEETWRRGDLEWSDLSSKTWTRKVGLIVLDG